MAPCKQRRINDEEANNAPSRHGSDQRGVIGKTKIPTKPHDAGCCTSHCSILTGRAPLTQACANR
jgi:hypothetical protein